MGEGGTTAPPIRSRAGPHTPPVGAMRGIPREWEDRGGGGDTMGGGGGVVVARIYRLRIQIGRFHCGAGGGCMACLRTSHLNWAVLFGLLSQHDKAKTASKVTNRPCLSWCRPWHCGRGRWSALATARNKVHQRLLRFHCLDLGHKQQAHYCTVTPSSACYRAAPSLADLLRNYAF